MLVVLRQSPAFQGGAIFYQKPPVIFECFKKQQ
jgi:hypothetical protein